MRQAERLEQSQGPNPDLLQYPPPTFTGSIIPGVGGGNNVYILDFTGSVTSWLAGAGGGNSGQETGGATYGGSANWNGSGDPPPIDPSLDGGPDYYANAPKATYVTVGYRNMFVYQMSSGDQADAQFSKIVEAMSIDAQIYGQDSQVSRSLDGIQQIVYSDSMTTRSYVTQQTGTLVLTAFDMIGGGGTPGYSATDIADRIVHDGWHVAQWQDGLTAGLKDYRTDPASMSDKSGLSRMQLRLSLDRHR